MKLTINKTTSETIELPEFPFYTKTESTYTAFVSENYTVLVLDSQISRIDFTTLSHLSKGFELITVDEFNAALLSTFESIKNKANAQ